MKSETAAQTPLDETQLQASDRNLQTKAVTEFLQNYAVRVLTHCHH